MESLMFDIRHVSHTFEVEEGKEYEALSDISLTVKKGEFMAVIGTNGSGKSTLARHMNALLLPTRGDLLVEGMSVLKEENMWNIRQKVGMVFQKSGQPDCGGGSGRGCSLWTGKSGSAPGTDKRAG